LHAFPTLNLYDYENQAEPRIVNPPQACPAGTGTPGILRSQQNRAAEKLFGLASAEMVGKHCQEVFRCVGCEPGCGVLVSLDQQASAANCTVRLAYR